MTRVCGVAGWTPRYFAAAESPVRHRRPFIVPIPLAGTAEDLGESPVVLEQLVESTSGLSWNLGHDGPKVGGRVSDEKLRSLNALLRSPLIDVREMEPDAVAEL